MALAPGNLSHEHRQLLRKIGADTAWVAAGRVADMAAVFMVNMLLAWWLAPSDFKSFLVLFNVLSLLSTIGTLGLNRSIVRFLADCLNAGRPDRAALVLRRSAIVTLACSTAIGVGLLIWHQTEPESPHGMALATALFFSVVLRSLQRVTAEALRALEHIRGASMFAGQNAGQAAGPATDLLFLGAVGLAYLTAEPSLTTAVVLNAAAVATTLPMSVWMIRRTSGRTFANHEISTQPVELREESIGSFAVTSAQMLVTQVLIFLTWNSDLWLADLCLAPRDAEVFIPVRNLLVVVMMPLSLINQAVLSSIPKLHGQGQTEKLERLLRTSSALAAVPTLAAIVAMTFFARPTLLLAYGSKYVDGAPYLAILAWGRLSNAFSGVASFTLTMTGHERVHLAISATATAIYWAIAPGFARTYGPTGLAIVTSVMFFLHQCALWIAVRRAIGVWCHAAIPRRRHRGSTTRLAASLDS